MKIITLNPPFFRMFSRSSRSPAVTKSSTLYYPFFLSYATGVLEDSGFDVNLIDAPAAKMDLDKTIKEVLQIKPDLLICDTSTPSIENDLEVMKILKQNGVPFIVAVGTHVSAMTDDVLKENTFIDAIARREYEYTLKELAIYLKDNKTSVDLNEIKGLSYRTKDTIVHNSDRDLIEDLDSLPFVSRVYKDHLNSHINSYFYGANLHPLVSILSGRGCPHKCAYCVYPQTMTGNKYRLRSVNNVVDELEFIKRELPHVREVFLEDDTLTVNKKRAQAISQEILDRGIKIKWSTNSRADADYDTMRIMREAGCRLICVGFESGSREILNKLGKNINREDYMKFRLDAARAGLLIHGCFMYGNDGETKETMQETLDLAKQLNPDSAQFYPIMVYPGTSAYTNYRKRGFITAKRYSDWLTKDGHHNCVVSISGITKNELLNFCDKSRRDFYLRPRYILSKMIQIVSHPTEAKRIIRASSTLLKFIFKPPIKDVQK